MLGATTLFVDRLAGQDQPDQRLRGIAGLVELFRTADPQPSGARGLAGVQRADCGAADDARRLRGAARQCSVSTATSRSPGSARSSPIWSSTSRSAGAQAISSSSAPISTTSTRSASARCWLAAMLGMAAYLGSDRSPPRSAFAPFIALFASMLVSPLSGLVDEAAAITRRGPTCRRWKPGETGHLLGLRQRLRVGRHGPMPCLRRADLLAVLHARIALPRPLQDELARRRAGARGTRGGSAPGAQPTHQFPGGALPGGGAVADGTLRGDPRSGLRTTWARCATPSTSSCASHC